MRAS
ncbi:hypothetical protein YPPY103_0167, partial [Yersinia pestis PY-103]|jgi:hypothetical protein